MKLLRVLLLLLGGFITAQAQFIEPVKWSFSSEVLENGAFQLNFHAKIQEGWHLYSHYIEDNGPIPTGFFYDDSEDFALAGDLTEEGDKASKYDEIFQMDLAWFSDKVTFQQNVDLSDGVESVQVTGYLEFMVCDDKQCLPPEEIPFRFSLRQDQGNIEEAEGELEDVSVDSEDTAEDNLEDVSVDSKDIVEHDLENASTDSEEVEVSDIGISEGEQDFISPVKWSYRVSDRESGNIILDWKAELDEHWHIYSTDELDNGPIPTTFYIDQNDHVELIGPILEGGGKITRHDDVFNMELSWFDEEVVFSQEVKQVDASNSTFDGSVEFMVCDDHQCLPPEELPFEIDMSQRGEWVAFDNVESNETSEYVGDIPVIMQSDEIDSKLAGSDCTGHSKTQSKNFLMIFLLGFGGGLIALLTPCVFPMIPLTVSFFTKGAEKADGKGVAHAFLYGLSIIVIYVSLGLLVTGFHGPEMLNWLSTNTILNVAFFLLFVFFAFSFFGYFDLTLPSSWTNKTDQMASKGGLIGIFFMAFTLALVSFSCTGPIIGTLIVEAATRGIQGPFFGMLGFSIALALPFTLFAVFPKWLNSLPQSGGWLNTVKVVLGFLELAFALKFFSIADLTRHWGILKYELFIGLWIIIFILLGLYLLRVYRFPHDSKGKPGVARIGFGVIAILFSVYLTHGVFTQKALLSGIAPSPGYSYFNPSDCPQAVDVCFHDYEEGMAYAQQYKKPVMLDFTGYGCVNCRFMEDKIWTDKEVKSLLNEYVLISLYVDDRDLLPEHMHYTSDAGGRVKEVRKVGKYWHDFQIRHFGTLSQPYYVLMSPDKVVLNKPVASSSKEEYKDFLQCGLDNLNGVCPECRSQVPIANN